MFASSLVWEHQAGLRALRIQKHTPVNPGGEMRRLHFCRIYLCEILIGIEDLMAASIVN